MSEDIDPIPAAAMGRSETALTYCANFFACSDKPRPVHIRQRGGRDSNTLLGAGDHFRSGNDPPFDRNRGDKGLDLPRDRRGRRNDCRLAL